MREKWRQCVTTKPWIWVESAERKESSGPLASRCVTTGPAVVTTAVAGQAQTVTQHKTQEKHKWRTRCYNYTSLHTRQYRLCAIVFLRPRPLSPATRTRLHRCSTERVPWGGGGGGVAWIRAGVRSLSATCCLSRQCVYQGCQTNGGFFRSARWFCKVKKNKKNELQFFNERNCCSKSVHWMSQ